MMLKVESGQWRLDPCHRDCSATFLVCTGRAVEVGERNQCELELPGSALWMWWTCSKQKESGESTLKFFLVSPLTFFLYFWAFTRSQDFYSGKGSLGLHPWGPECSQPLGFRGGDQQGGWGGKWQPGNDESFSWPGNPLCCIYFFEKILLW